MIYLPYQIIWRFYTYKDRVVFNGYIKLLALSIGHLETEIIMERNTNSQYDIDAFKQKYGNIKSVIIFIIHMDYDNDIMFEDYQKVCEDIHCFDYLRNLINKKNGKMIERNDIENDELWDTKRIKYVEEKFY